MNNWSELCVELLELIANQLSTIEDFVRFRAVCRPWRSVLITKQQFSPMLMMLSEEGHDYYSFYGPLTQKVYRLKLPEIRWRRFLTAGGWLITDGFGKEEILLINPFSHKKIWLPQLPMMKLYVEKLIISSSPKTSSLEDDEEKCEVMVITDIRKILAFLRKGDKAWTMIEIDKFITDVIYFHGQFYAITSSAELLMVDISGPQPKTVEIAEGIDRSHLYPCALWRFYLVESEGELFLLERYLSSTVLIQTKGFGVLKFNFDNRMWTQVMSLDNCAMFVGAYASSFSIFPSNEFEWQPNCVYFTNDIHRPSSRTTRKRDMGVFRLDTQEIQNFFNCGPGFCHTCAALWVQPSL